MIRFFLLSSIIVLALMASMSLVQAQPIFKIGIEGLLRTGYTEVPINDGPIFLKTRIKRLSYAFSFGYEYKKNGAELYITNLPYRTDLVFTNMVSDYLTPTNITLYNLLCKRQILFFPRSKLGVYVGAGLGIGRFKYFKIVSDGVGTLSVNNQVIFKDYIYRTTTYTNSSVLFPMVTFSIEKKLFWHFILSLNGSYNPKNLLSQTPLETSDFWYEYYQKRVDGTINDYGQGYQLGLSLKYQIMVKKKSSIFDFK